ncbi:hypothetical protein NI18_12645 [Sphingomonas sp. Ant20]|nr:hypothetical protein NI18_12645 [Sphingomonas sp. Ant20]
MAIVPDAVASILMIDTALKSPSRSSNVRGMKPAAVMIGIIARQNNTGRTAGSLKTAPLTRPNPAMMKARTIATPRLMLKTVDDNSAVRFFSRMR